MVNGQRVPIWDARITYYDKHSKSWYPVDHVENMISEEYEKEIQDAKTLMQEQYDNGTKGNGRGRDSYHYNNNYEQNVPPSSLVKAYSEYEADIKEAKKTAPVTRVDESGKLLPYEKVQALAKEQERNNEIAQAQALANFRKKIENNADMAAYYTKHLSLGYGTDRSSFGLPSDTEILQAMDKTELFKSLPGVPTLRNPRIIHYAHKKNDGVDKTGASSSSAAAKELAAARESGDKKRIKKAFKKINENDFRRH